MTFLTDDLLTALRREHTCAFCTGRNDAAGTEAANLGTEAMPASPGGVIGQAPPVPSFESDPLD